MIQADFKLQRGVSVIYTSLSNQFTLFMRSSLVNLPPYLTYLDLSIGVDRIARQPGLVN
jgi:hypothetical protein